MCFKVKLIFWLYFDGIQEEANRGKPNWEHLNDKLHVLITVEDSNNRANLKIERAVNEIKKLLIPIVGFQFTLNCFLNICLNVLLFFSKICVQTEGEDELKKRQLMELAIINGTYRDSSQRNSSVFCLLLIFMFKMLIDCLSICLSSRAVHAIRYRRRTVS